MAGRKPLTRSTRHWPTLLGILLLAFALRLHHLAGQDLWGDEAFSVGVMQMPLEAIIRPGVETHPPLYHVLMFFWGRVAVPGPYPLRWADPFPIRVGSLIFGLLAVPVTYALARRLPGQRVALLAALLAAVSPMQVYYAQEIRMYSLLLLTTVLSAWAFVRLTQRPNRAAWAVYLGTTLAAMVVHYNAFWVLAAQNAIALFTDAWRGRRVRWQGGQAILALVYLPWILAQSSFLAERGGAKGDYALSLAQIVSILQQSLRSWGVGVTHSGDLLTLLAVIAGLISAGLGLIVFWRRARWQGMLLGGWVAFTLLMVVLIDPLMPFVFNERFALAGITAFLILAAEGVLWTTKRHRLAGIALIVPLILGGLAADFNWYHDPHPNRQLVAEHHWQTTPADDRDGYADAMRAIAADATADGDVILFSNMQQGALYNYYAPPDVPHVLLDTGLVNSTQTDSYLSGVVDDARRVWLVEFGEPSGYDSMRLVPGWLAERGFRQRFFSYQGGTVSLYVMGGDDAPLVETDVQFGAHIRLTGYRLTPENALPGDVLRLSLRWEALSAPQARYTVGSYVLSEGMQLVAQTDAEPRGGASPTDTWQPGQIIEDRYAIPLPGDLPPGSYVLGVGLYAWPDPTRIPVQGGEHLDNALLLTRFSVGGEEAR